MVDDGKDTSPKDGEPKLIAGKYKTVEEAERAIQEKDQMIGRQGAELGTLRKENDSLKASRSQDDGYHRGARTDPDAATDDEGEEALAHDLLTRPKATLRRLFKSFGEQMETASAGQALRIVDTALAVERFFGSHPEVRKHSKLFSSFLAETDQSEDVETRLQKAKESLDTALGAAREEGRKNTEAQRNARRKVEDGIVRDEGDEGMGVKKDEDDDTPDTPESYMAARNREYARLKGVL